MDVGVRVRVRIADGRYGDVSVDVDVFGGGKQCIVGGSGQNGDCA